MALIDNNSCQYDDDDIIPFNPNEQVDCNKVYELEQWMQDKFCGKCEGIGDTPIPVMGPYGSLNSNYCICCDPEEDEGDKFKLSEERRNQLKNNFLINSLQIKSGIKK